MERLTARYNGQAVMAWEHEEKYSTETWIEMLTTRLAEYEDTGLTPEDFALGINAAAREGGLGHYTRGP